GLMWYLNRVRHPQFNNPPGYNPYQSVARSMLGGSAKPRGDTYESLQDKGIVLVGSPDTMIKKIRYLHERCGIGHMPMMTQARGAFVNLEGTGGVNDLQLLEIPPGGSTAPVKHMFEALVYVVSGRGSSSVGYDQTLTFEWGPGSLFAIPLNATYRFFNASGTRPARLAMVTNAPTIMNLFHSDRFIFDNPFQFDDRFGSQ